MKEIQIHDIETLKNKEPNLILINVLDKDSFEKEHIPDSINIPADTPDLPDKVKTIVKDVNAPIIVYCAKPECPASGDAGIRLEESGFTNIMHYAGGMQEWKKSGKRVDSGL